MGSSVCMYVNKYMYKDMYILICILKSYVTYCVEYKNINKIVGILFWSLKCHYVDTFVN